VNTQRRLVAVASLVVGLAACGSKPSQPSPSGETVARPASGRIWWSSTTGREYRVWVEKDLVRTEWVNLPAAVAARGAFVRSECRRTGEKWVGTVRSYLPCESTESSGRVSNRCHLETGIEIDSMTVDRIAGRAQALRKFDCRTCRVIEATWVDFLWIPKGQ
jgi:hypothetical protein